MADLKELNLSMIDVEDALHLMDMNMHLVLEDGNVTGIVEN